MADFLNVPRPPSRAQIEAELLAGLRARAEALPTVNVDGHLYVGMVWWQDVVDLIDGAGR